MADQTSPAAEAVGAASPAGRLAAMRARRAEIRENSSDPLLTAAEAAAETGRAISTFWRDVRRGALPAGRYVCPRSPRWRRSELRAIVEAAPRTPRN